MELYEPIDDNLQENVDQSIRQVPGRKTRNFVLAILIIAPFAIGLLAVVLGQDANWDLRNYHWYNAYAFLNGRFGFDLLPSQTPYFYNPTIDVPFYLLATHVSAFLAQYILGVVQGLNFILLFMLAYSVLVWPNFSQKVIVCILLATIGMLGGLGISLLGTTYYDNVTSIGLFLSILLIVHYGERFLTVRLASSLGRGFLFGIPMGLMVGLKLPSMLYCPGLCLALALTAGPLKRRLFISIAFGLGILFGAGVSLGHWALFLQSHYGSPLFPFFNNYFKSPLAPLTSARDAQFMPANFKEFVLYPYIFSNNSLRIGENIWCDWRLAILYTLLPIALLVRLVAGSDPVALSMPYATRYLLWWAAISYLVWLVMFSIGRYAVPLEMMAPLLIVVSAGIIPLKIINRVMLAGLLLLIIVVTVRPGNWDRRTNWLDHTVEVEIPPLGDTSDLMILMAGNEPYSDIIPEFPPEIPFVRIQSNFGSLYEEKPFNKLVRERVESHRGRILLLIPPDQKKDAIRTLPYLHLSLVSEPCDIVVDRLHDNWKLELCKIRR
ncbi:MAG: hypothetical protein HQL37_03940 [Alphaproteobacteria bacterium]|nr:hypothetical protein [Alphaproteobacteria bacterium]